MSAVEMAECPDCQGQGSIYSPNFGPHAVEPFSEKPCGACEGTGLVDADRVVVCGVCGVTDWVGHWCRRRDCVAELRAENSEWVADVAAGYRSLVDPMSGRINNWGAA